MGQRDGLDIQDVPQPRGVHAKDTRVPARGSDQIDVQASARAAETTPFEQNVGSSRRAGVAVFDAVGEVDWVPVRRGADARQRQRAIRADDAASTPLPLRL